MKKHAILNRFIATLLIVALILATVGCKSANVADNENTPELEHMVSPDRTLFVGETLTIAEMFNTRELRFVANKYMRENPGVTIEVIDYFGDYERDGHLLEVQKLIASQLMAGSGPVLIEAALADYLDPRSATFFCDWYPVMAADPGFGEEDWFMNVFHAVSVNGRLTAFPIHFIYSFIAANSTIPGLPEAMAGKDGITMSEMMELHREMQGETAYSFEPFFDLTWIRELYIDSFINLETGWVDINNERFIELITYAERITDRDISGSIHSSGYQRTEASWSERYFFYITNPIQYQHLVDFEESLLFSGNTPLVNDLGELVMYPTQGYILSVNATPTEQALAWDFLKFMMEPDNYQISYYGSMQPTNRNILRFTVEEKLPSDIRDNNWRLTGTANEAAEDLIAKMTAFGEMPMHNMRSLPDAIIGMPAGVFPEAMRQFQDGLVSAEQTALNLQNQVELVLMEISR